MTNDSTWTRLVLQRVAIALRGLLSPRPAPLLRTTVELAKRGLTPRAVRRTAPIALSVTMERSLVRPRARSVLRDNTRTVLASLVARLARKIRIPQKVQRPLTFAITPLQCPLLCPPLTLPRSPRRCPR